MIVSVATRKGGGGKTPVCAHLSTYLHTCGVELALADADPQQTLTKWHARGIDRIPEPADIPPTLGIGKGGHATLLALRQKYPLLIVDTSAGFSDQVELVFAVSDWVLVPIATRPADLESGFESLERLLRVQSEVRRALRLAIVVTQQRRTGFYVAAEEALRQHAAAHKVPVLRTPLHYYAAYDRAHARGVGVTQYAPTSIAANEVRAAATELYRLLTGKRVPRGRR